MFKQLPSIDKVNRLLLHDYTKLQDAKIVDLEGLGEEVRHFRKVKAEGIVNEGLTLNSEMMEMAFICSW